MNTGQERPSFVLGRDASEAQRLRRFVAESCRGLARDTVATAQLLASELFANALDHGDGDVTVRVSRTPGELRIDVADSSPRTPQIRSVDAHDVRGRGLMILEALALRWGVDTAPGGGKSVWFTLRTAD